jgi:hypothetical protein
MYLLLSELLFLKLELSFGVHTWFQSIPYHNISTCKNIIISKVQTMVHTVFFRVDVAQGLHLYL